MSIQYQDPNSPNVLQTVPIGPLVGKLVFNYPGESPVFIRGAREIAGTRARFVGINDWPAGRVVLHPQESTDSLKVNAA